MLDERVLDDSDRLTYRSILLNGNGALGAGVGVDDDEAEAEFRAFRAAGIAVVLMDFFTASIAAVPAAVALVLKFLAPALKLAKALAVFDLTFDLLLVGAVTAG